METKNNIKSYHHDQWNKLQQLNLNFLQISILKLAEEENEMIDPEKLLEIYHESIPGFFKALNEGTDIWEYAQKIVSKAKEASSHKLVEECIGDDKSNLNQNNEVRKSQVDVCCMAQMAFLDFMSSFSLD